MFLTAEIWAYLGIVALLTVTPGADVMLVIRSALSGGQRVGARTTLGICAGLMVHVTLSAVGVSLILVQSAAAFSVVKLLGAGYLVFLGGQSLWNARQGVPAGTEGMQMNEGEKRDNRPFLQGFLTNLLNPKVAVFYLAFLPQFIKAGEPVLLKSLFLGGIHIGMSFLCLMLLNIMMGKLQHIFTRPAWQQILHSVSGFVLVGLGIRLALEQT